MDLRQAAHDNPARTCENGREKRNGPVAAFKSAASNLCLLRPALLTKRNFLVAGLAGAVEFALPGPVFTETELSVVGIVEVDLRDLGLNKCPYTPIVLSC